MYENCGESMWFLKKYLVIKMLILGREMVNYEYEIYLEVFTVVLDIYFLASVWDMVPCSWVVHGY
jgi:hypothetical protein